MNDTIQIDEIDIKILNMLIKDARTRLKDIAKECKTSSVSVLNRIKRMKKHKLITGATLYPDVSALGLPIAATIGISFDGNYDEGVLKLLEQQTFVVEPAPSVGEYDFCAFVFAKSIAEIDQIACLIKDHFSAKSITINVWSGPPHNNFLNVDLQPKENR